jgi:hypothetical protein
MIFFVAFNIEKKNNPILSFLFKNLHFLICNNETQTMMLT